MIAVNGSFLIRRVQWGTYAVEADKPGAGYPTVIAFGGIYGRRQFPWATLSPQAPAATVVVRIGPKAGILSGTIVNARTGKSITQARIDLKRMGHARTQTSEAVRAHFTLLIPSEMAITLTVHARGFEPWHETVKMASGERKVLMIRLRPLAP